MIYHPTSQCLPIGNQSAIHHSRRIPPPGAPLVDPSCPAQDPLALTTCVPPARAGLPGPPSAAQSAVDRVGRTDVGFLMINSGAPGGMGSGRLVGWSVSRSIGRLVCWCLGWQVTRCFPAQHSGCLPSPSPFPSFSLVGADKADSAPRGGDVMSEHTHTYTMYLSYEPGRKTANGLQRHHRSIQDPKGIRFKIVVFLIESIPVRLGTDPS